jgi:hypothetical protein
LFGPFPNHVRHRAEIKSTYVILQLSKIVS